MPSRPGLVLVPDDPDRPGGAARRGFGHTLDRSAVIEHEADAIREAARRVLGGETLSSIVQEWNRRGMRTASGGPWRVNSLSSILVQPRLAGLNGQVGGAYPPILDEDVHLSLVALHASRRKGPRRVTRRYLLTGLLRCWRCGGGMRGMPRTRGADLYVCPGPAHGGCSGTAITADRADDAMRDMLAARVDAPDFLDSRPRGPTGSRRQAALGRLAEHRRRLDDLAELWAAGQLGRDEWLSLKARVGAKARDAEAELAALNRIESLRSLSGTGRAILDAWPDMAAEARRELLHAAVDHVVVLQAEPPRQVFRPERLQPVWMG